MTGIFLTAYSGSILGPIARLLGVIMNGIYSFMAACGIENVALAIFVFTVFIYLCLFPVTYRTQKFSVLTRKMSPEINAIRDKYKGKRDQASMQAMQDETQMVYDKYGISPTGSCVYMFIQMPILLALYRVFNNIPAYLGNVKGIFTDLVDGIAATDGFRDTMQTVYENAGIANIRVDFTAENTDTVKNYIIDVLYKLSESGWSTLSDSFPSLTELISSTHEKLSEINYFFVLNVSDTPLNMIRTGWSGKIYALVICAALIPICAYLSQLLNLKMMPSTGDDEQARQMRTMNMMMPLMSLFFSFSVPVGLSLYWIAGALVRTVQQVLLNRHFEKIDLDEIIEKNKEEARKKQEKRGIRREQLMQAATTNTRYRSLSERAGVLDKEEKEEALSRAAALRESAPKGSMSAKANLVKNFNEGKK